MARVPIWLHHMPQIRCNIEKLEILSIVFIYNIVQDWQYHLILSVGILKWQDYNSSFFFCCYGMKGTLRLFIKGKKEIVIAPICSLNAASIFCLT